MSDRYALFGNPVRHSKSPAIHAAFARQCGEDLSYAAILAPSDGFAASVRSFIAAGGRGANVTVPFKEQAYRLASELSERAELAGAVNTLVFAGASAAATHNGATIFGDNTDGAGLLRDLCANLAVPLAGRCVLLLGAGGAARGVVAPLLAARPATLTIANRDADRARALIKRFAAGGVELRAGGYPELAGAAYDLVINATSASLGGALPPLPPGIFAAGSLAYDMMYGGGETPFLAFARIQGAARLADGLGMLVEQAAESFALWRGVRPQTAPVLAMLRAGGNCPSSGER